MLNDEPYTPLYFLSKMGEIGQDSSAGATIETVPVSSAENLNGQRRFN